MKPLTRIILLSLAVFTAALSAAADSATTKVRTVTRLAEGIYEIRHEDSPDSFPQSNTLVVIGDREVLVVDSCYLPSTAKQDIAQIKQWTSKPVRYLVNTHWHYDHTMGNQSYADAFPGLEIIAHSETRKHEKGYNPGWLERFPKRTLTLKQQLETGKDADGKPISDQLKKELPDAIKGRELIAQEFAKVVDHIPTMGFADALDIDLGNREVQLRHLGRGNTSGDAIVYLPKEKILAAGDLLDHPIPYLGGGYPVELITTLEKMGQYEIETIVPGHGDLMHDKVYLNQVISLLKTVVAAVSKEIYRIGNGSRNLEAVREAVLKDIDVAGLTQQFAGDDNDDREFFTGFSLGGSITAAYAELWGK